MSEPDDNLVPCDICGTLIEGRHTHRQQGFVSIVEMICVRTRCIECTYQENFRTSRLVRGKPYRDPFPRPTAEGKMPADLRAELAKYHEQQKAQS